MMNEIEAAETLVTMVDAIAEANGLNSEDIVKKFNNITDAGMDDDAQVDTSSESCHSKEPIEWSGADNFVRLL